MNKVWISFSHDCDSHQSWLLLLLVIPSKPNTGENAWNTFVWNGFKCMKILPSNKYTQSSRGCVSCRYKDGTIECSCTVSIITVLTITIELMAVFCKSVFLTSQNSEIYLCFIYMYSYSYFKLWFFIMSSLWFFFCRPWFQFYKNLNEIMFWWVLRTLQYKMYIIPTHWSEVCELSGDTGVLPCCRGVVVYCR